MIIGLLILLIAIAFDHVNIKAEIFRVKNLDLGKLDEHLTSCIERLEKGTEGEQTHKDKLCKADKAESLVFHDDFCIQDNIENRKAGFKEVLSSYKDHCDQLDKTLKQLEHTSGNTRIH